MKLPAFFFTNNLDFFEQMKQEITKQQTQKRNAYVDDAFYEKLIYYPSIPEPVFENLSKIFRKERPAVICTVGDIGKGYSGLEMMPHEIRKRWIHVSSPKEIHPDKLVHCYMAASEVKDEKEEPLLSVITSAFNSGDKIMRPYNSLLKQTYRNWEWIIFDDSKQAHEIENIEEKLNELSDKGRLVLHGDAVQKIIKETEQKNAEIIKEKTWKHLRELESTDIRIRIYRASGNSAYIGEMKELAGKLARGKWIIELDHDDDIVPDLFQWIVDAYKMYPNAGFIYSDCIECAENTCTPFAYENNFFGFGYQCYIKQLVKGEWQNVCQCAPINPVTLRGIIGVPNHVRCWRTDVYQKMGAHKPSLPVVDDYDLIMRTILESPEGGWSWVRISELGYIQYRNENGNNFTFLRNQLIQKLKNMTAWYNNKNINEFFTKVGVKDDRFI